MTTTPNARAKGQGSIYQRKDNGLWVVSLPLPPMNGKRRSAQTTLSPHRPDGTPKTATEITRQTTKALGELRRKRDANGGDLPTGATNLGSWLTYWHAEIVCKEARPKTAANYAAVISNHITPTIGTVKLQKLTAEHVRRVPAAIEAKGIGAATSILAYRVLSLALDQAVRDGKLTRNVVELVKTPRKASKDLVVLSPAHGVKVLHEVAHDRLGSRWAAALLTGARQGELLGLELDRIHDYVDEDGYAGKVLTLSWQLQRIAAQHGCGTKGTSWPCGKSKGADCPRSHTVFPRDSEHRHLEGGLWLVRPKSKAGYRIVPLVEPLKSIIERRMMVAATEPNPHGLLWTSDPKLDRHGRFLVLDGSPIDPAYDNKHWHAVLKRAGTPDARLHDARHTTASLLLAAGVPEPIIMRILGHSSFAVSKGYMSVDRKQLTAALESISALMPLGNDLPQLEG